MASVLHYWNFIDVTKEEIRNAKNEGFIASNENSIPLWHMTLGNQLPML